MKINETNRLTLDELKEYKQFSGITDLQFEIIKYKYYDAQQLSTVAICYKLNISTSKYNAELKKALIQIDRYCKLKTN